MSRLVPNTVLLGKYRVEHLLGQGAMGAVYAAHHIDLGERVAIKCLTEELMGAHGAVERFLREARAAHRLRNKHICQVFDVGRFENGAPYMVMEYLDGEDLMKRVDREGPLPIDLAARCLAQAADALVEAHAAGIIHRDIKPANILLTRTADGQPTIKVLDFGIAKLANEASVELTRTSTMIGSAMYMSPEQIRSAKHVDARSDIWSLGVTLYRLLVAAAPFVAESIPELCVKVVSEDPRPPTDFRPEIPSELERLVLRCLQKDPALRYQTAADLRDALEPFTRYQAAPAGAFLDDAPTEIAFPAHQRDEGPRGIVPAAGGRAAPLPPAPSPPAFQPPPPPAARPMASSGADLSSPYGAPPHAPAMSADAGADGLIPSEQFTTVAAPGLLMGLGMPGMPGMPGSPGAPGMPSNPSMPSFGGGPGPNGFGDASGQPMGQGGFGAPSFAMNGQPSALNGFPPMPPAPLAGQPTEPAPKGKKPTTEQIVVISAAAAVLLLTIAAAARAFLGGGSTETDQPVVLAVTTASATPSASVSAAPEAAPTESAAPTEEPPPPPPPPTASAEPAPPPVKTAGTKKGSATTSTVKKKTGGPASTTKKGPTRTGPIPIKR
jgi:serine/threonine-protein kinase